MLLDKTEKEGFEPSAGFNDPRLVSSEFLSTTQAPLHNRPYYILNNDILKQLITIN